MRHAEFAVTAIAAALILLGQVLNARTSAVGSSVVVGAALCARIPGLVKSQRELCRKSPYTMPIVSEGAELGLKECRHQFRNHRWNCSNVVNQDDQVFGHVVTVGSREAAFTYAISSAGVTYAVTAACSRGNITACGCEPPMRTRKEIPPNGWEWGGCSADVTFGMRFARRFLDAREIEGDSRSLMNLHNNKAGRKIVKSLLQTECKCHGVSGSCTVRTCWRTLPSFRQIGDALMKKYYRARPVIAVTPPPPPPTDSSAGPTTILQSSESLLRSSLVSPILSNDAKTQIMQQHPLRSLEEHGWRRSPSGVARHEQQQQSRRPHLLLKRAKLGNGPALTSQKRIPKRSELVFLQPSPNYCDLDLAQGSLGTQGRYCNRTSRGTDGCEVMCCGRGYNTHQYTKNWQCNCKFQWCCKVNCDTCTERIEEYTCK